MLGVVMVPGTITGTNLSVSVINYAEVSPINSATYIEGLGEVCIKVYKMLGGNMGSRSSHNASMIVFYGSNIATQVSAPSETTDDISTI